MDINKILIVGRLTKDAEKKATQTGVTVARFSLANGYRKKSGETWADEVNYFDCVLIGCRAESVCQYLIKGKQVVIEGTLRQNRWEQDGEKKSKVEIVVDNIQLISPTGLTQQKVEQAGPESFEDDEIPF